MDRYRFSKHNMDTVFKLEARQLGSALARRFGIDLPPVVRYFPTEVAVADLHLEQLDSVFELADGSLLHLEFQTTHRQETLMRFLIYDVHLHELHGRHIYTVVIYGANVTAAAAELSFGVVQYRVTNVLLGQEDGEATYRRLRAQLASGAGLRPEDRLDVIFLPLMQHQRPRQEVVRDAVELARQLPERQQRQTLASLIGLGHRFLTDTELDALMEGLMSTSIGQRLIDRGWQQGREQGLQQGREQGLQQGREQGLQQGREQGLQQAVLRVLTRRFTAVPSSLAKRLSRIDEPQRLESLLDAALTARSLEEFTQGLE